MEEIEERVPLWRSYVELLRLPNIFTAIADVAMGFLFVRVAAADQVTSLPSLDRWTLGLLVAASSILYAAGVVLNDVLDIERDRDERPDRPLPSGRISLRVARWLGWELLLVGSMLPCVVAILVGQSRPAVVGILLAGAIVLYNALLKRTIVGPLGMGACRMLNVLLGMSVLADPLGAEHWLVAGGIGVYILGVTWFARNEFQRSDRRQLAAATLAMVAGVAMLGWLPRWTEDLVLPASQWYLAMALLGGYAASRCLWAIVVPTPGRVKTVVAQSILTLVFLDAAVCCAVSGPYWGLMIVILVLPARFLAYWIQMT